MSKEYIAITRTRRERILEEKLKTSKNKNVKFIGYVLAGTIATSALMNVNHFGVGTAQACVSVYTVQKGDTLQTLSKQFGVTVEQIQNANGLDSAQIKVGQELELPGMFYKVLPGDTLSSIAKKHQTTVKEIKTFNKLTSDLIKINQTLLMPLTSHSSNEDKNTFEAVQKDQQQPSTTIYTVVPGDTLSRIALIHNTSVNEIKRLNNLTSDLIRINQKMKMPLTNHSSNEFKVTSEQVKKDQQQPSTNVYTVVRGDTLSRIAFVHKTSVNEIKRLNNLTSDLIKMGQLLKTPTMAMQENPESQSVDKPKNNANVQEVVKSAIYTAVPGDTLWAISRHFNTPIDVIKKNNGLKNDTILIGQKLVINHSNIVTTKATVVGAVDSTHVAFYANNLELVLKVPYGQSQKYEKLAGETVNIVFQNSDAPALINHTKLD
ncbi:LysM peptidoglycan-binding domain-containing protein [Halalkalibacter alkalisediminis]|uniref:LysM peptidoglycan-binding domain-containing protein n=1 Tax=Halalkalibacter alkalisediminis TaxID=935616 RepID=A0ABV6NET2_9BACI|nr:LysM peptidoglycan-binding domain-containing protein [Halalkalibacter alkalisediminis]